MINNKHIWITWERQTRNRSMATLLGARYVEFTHKKGLLRYIILSLKTLMFFIKNKPETIFFQNPSVVLGLVCVIYSSIFKKTRLVGDYHNCALDGSSRLYAVNCFIAKRSSFVIVTNPSLEIGVKKMGGRSISFPDPLPQVSLNQEVNASKAIVFVTSWADDEPINEVLDAFTAAQLNENGFSVLITGKPKFFKLRHPQAYYEECNIKFLGFVSEELYWELLSSAFFVIDLTTRENCMVCGAYEALAVRRMLLLSNNQATREYFGSGLVYTDNTKEDIQEKLIYMCNNMGSLNVRARETVEAVLIKQEANASIIKEMLNSI